MNTNLTASMFSISDYYVELCGKIATQNNDAYEAEF